MSVRKLSFTSKLMLLAAVVLVMAAGLPSTVLASADTATAPREITPTQSCGKCGMFPAKYPRWQTQVIFSDGTMVPFDGCKCMFGYLLNMQKYDQHHRADDVATIWVREFNTGDWIDATSAHYVIDSDVMGPMGKELIPFAEAGSAETFQKEHGGTIALYDAIKMETLKPLMGKMHMKGKMEKKGHMDM